MRGCLHIDHGVSRLINNVEADIPHLHTLTEIQKLRLSYTDLLLGVAANPGVAREQPGDFIAVVAGPSSEELLSSG
jgi:hypothetical protein